MKRNVDVLSLEFTSWPSRDRIIASLVCNYLRYKGYNVVEKCIFNSYYEINKYKPKVLFISNSIGAAQNLDAVIYAKKRGIKVVTSISEGIITDYSKIDIFLWGLNSKKIMHEDYNLLWTKKMLDICLNKYPNLSEKLIFNGAIGFDLYLLKKQISKSSFLEKYNKQNYKKIIGFACWDFGIIEESDPRFGMNFELYNKDLKLIENFKHDRIKLNNIILETIKNNPDYLFLLKVHPGMLGDLKYAAVVGCEKYNNVIIIRNEESIFDCISVSDIWMAYESTTILEAWLLKKQTIVINPSITDFPRPNIYKGSILVKSYDELNKSIDNILINRNDFNLTELQKEILFENIGHYDGKNHIRASEVIIKILKENFKLKNENFYLIVKRIYKNFKWRNSEYLAKLFKGFKHMAMRKKQFNEMELDKISRNLFELQINFYNSNKI